MPCPEAQRQMHRLPPRPPWKQSAVPRHPRDVQPGTPRATALQLPELGRGSSTGCWKTTAITGTRALSAIRRKAEQSLRCGFFTVAGAPLSGEVLGSRPGYRQHSRAGTSPVARFRWLPWKGRQLHSPPASAPGQSCPFPFCPESWRLPMHHGAAYCCPQCWRDDNILQP